MQIFIQIITGKKIPFEVNNDTTVLSLKEKFSEKESIPLDAFELVFSGIWLKDDQTLADYNIADGETIHVYYRMRSYAGDKLTDAK